MMLFLQVTLAKQMKLGEEPFNGFGSSSPKHEQSLQIRTTSELLQLGRRKTVGKLPVFRK